MQLTKNDYDKILECMDVISFDPDVQDLCRYRQNVLDTLSEIFDYRQSIFWLANKDGELSDPLLNNIKNKIIYEYLEFFYSQDLLIPNNLPVIQNDVVKVGDIMSLTSFSETVFFQEFFRKHQFIDEMGVYISNKNRLIAVIGLVRKEGENFFNEQDKHRLRFIVRAIESAFIAYDIFTNNHLRESAVQLTEREKELIKFVKQGLTNQQIADIMYISINTVKKHLQNVYKKLKVANRTELCYLISSKKITSQLKAPNN